MHLECGTQIMGRILRIHTTLAHLHMLWGKHRVAVNPPLDSPGTEGSTRLRFILELMQGNTPGSQWHAFADSVDCSRV